MSYPVFLNASSEPRMPDGSKNEWRNFWAADAVELEGAGWPPLLWLALFKVSDIKRARVIDDEDIDSEGREDLKEFGEATYPYLLASRDSALATLASRRQAILDGMGAQAEPVLASFEALLDAEFPRFILCRTSGICDVTDAGPGLEKNLTDFDRLAAGDLEGNSIVDLMTDILKQRPDTQRFLLAGVRQDTVAEDATPPEQPARYQAPEKKTTRRSSEWLDWLSAFIVGIPTAAVYMRERSVMLAILTFCTLVAVVVFVRVKLLSHRD